MVIRLLLLADAAQVPEDNSTVVATASEDGLLERVPGQRSHGILVAFEGVEFAIQVSQIPDGNGLVCRGGCQDEFRRRVEGQRVDGICVALAFYGCLVELGLASIDDLKGQVVGDRADQGFV